MKQFKVLCDIHKKEPLVKASFNTNLEIPVFCNACIKNLSKTDQNSLLTIKEFVNKVTDDLNLCLKEKKFDTDPPSNLSDILKNQNTIKKKLAAHMDTNKIYLEKVFALLKEEIIKTLDEQKKKIIFTMETEIQTLNRNFEDYSSKLFTTYTPNVKGKEQKNYASEPEKWIYDSITGSEAIENTKKALWFYNNALAYHKIVRDNPESISDTLNSLKIQLEKAANRLPIFNLQLQKDAQEFVKEITENLRSQISDQFIFEDSINSIQLLQPLDNIPSLNSSEMDWLLNDLLKSKSVRFLPKSLEFDGEISKLLRAIHECGRSLLVIKTLEGERLFYYTDKSQAFSANHRIRTVINHIPFSKAIKDNNLDKYQEKIELSAITLNRNFFNATNHYLFGSEYRTFVVKEIEVYQVLGEVGTLEKDNLVKPLINGNDLEFTFADRSKQAFHRRQMSAYSTRKSNF